MLKTFYHSPDNVTHYIAEVLCPVCCYQVGTSGMFVGQATLVERTTFDPPKYFASIEVHRDGTRMAMTMHRCPTAPPPRPWPYDWAAEADDEEYPDEA